MAGAALARPARLKEQALLTRDVEMARKCRAVRGGARDGPEIWPIRASCREAIIFPTNQSVGGKERLFPGAGNRSNAATNKKNSRLKQKTINQRKHWGDVKTESRIEFAVWFIKANSPLRSTDKSRRSPAIFGSG